MKTTSEVQEEVASALVKAIAAHPFVAGMAPGHLKRLIEVAMFRRFEPNEIIFHEGEPANRFYLVCRGKIALETRLKDEPASPVQFLGAGDVLGWSWLFPPYYWHFDARAVEPTSAIFFYGTRLREECDEDPAFGYGLMERVAEIAITRLQSVRSQLLQAQQ